MIDIYLWACLVFFSGHVLLPIDACRYIEITLTQPVNQFYNLDKKSKMSRVPINEATILNVDGGHEGPDASEAFDITEKTPGVLQSQLHDGHVPTEDRSAERGREDMQHVGFFPEVSDLDLKSKGSKYKRWSPKMDQYLVKLLSDVVHSYPAGIKPEMTKKTWAYVTGQLRALNPETVYSTYTKYSCQQHIYHVVHHRYKIWYLLMIHLKNSEGARPYFYRWSVERGKFEIRSSDGDIIEDERQIKSVLLGGGLSLPSLTSFNKGHIILSDFFLTDNLKYMTVYHSEILPMLMRLDTAYAVGLEDVYHTIPKFEVNNVTSYSKPLIPPKVVRDDYKYNKRRRLSESRLKSQTETNTLHNNFPDNEVGDVRGEDSVDPLLRKSKHMTNESTTGSELENTLAAAAIAAINSPPVVNNHDNLPVYIKDRKWFNKLISLHVFGHLSSNEVLTVCEGVRDKKIPFFMLNILDESFYSSRDHDNEATHLESSDEDVARKVRVYMLPMA